jgi:hypothetical protein
VLLIGFETVAVLFEKIPPAHGIAKLLEAGRGAENKVLQFDKFHDEVFTALMAQYLVV